MSEHGDEHELAEQIDQGEVADTPEVEHEEPIGNLDEEESGDAPDDAVAESLRAALGTMREEADRIAALGTGDEQVAAAEQFAEDAGKLDEQVGSAARAAESDERG
jgi:hypothetical protein